MPKQNTKPNVVTRSMAAKKRHDNKVAKYIMPLDITLKECVVMRQYKINQKYKNPSTNVKRKLFLDLDKKVLKPKLVRQNACFFNELF